MLGWILDLARKLFSVWRVCFEAVRNEVALNDIHLTVA